ncbi:MAG TPA: hypothetical protein VLD37_01410 [Candidatus Bilamarchaeum sp.]|nr:hypothetical protein [Candidatus Bilamarchaeum sp.]
MFERQKQNAAAKEPTLEPTDSRVLKINAALRTMRAAFEKKKADPDDVLVELTKFAEGELAKDPKLSASHRFSYVKGQVERRLLTREDA